MVFSDKPWQCEFYELSLKQAQINDEEFDIAFLETSVGSRRYSQFDHNLDQLDKNIDKMKSHLTSKTQM